jgi:hypothetical protein
MLAIEGITQMAKKTQGNDDEANDEDKADDEVKVQLPVMVDLGRQSKKRIRRLRKGRGKLIDDINRTIAELRTAKKIAATVQPVIYVVKQKRSKSRWSW